MPAANSDLERALPRNLEAERSVLGALLLDESQLPVVLEILKKDSFFLEGHRLIYQTMCQLTEKGRPIDLITLTEELERAGVLERAGGMPYVAGLADDIPRTVNVEHYARIVRERSMLRDLIHSSQRIIELCHGSDEEPARILDRAEQYIFEIAEEKQRKGFIPLREVIQSSYRNLEAAQAEGSGYGGLATGFVDFDEMTTGLQKGDLIIIAARPAMGKTSLCLNIAQHAGMELGHPVAVFSLEMSADQLALRLLCAEARVNSQKVRRRMVSSSEWKKLAGAMGRLARAPIFIDDTPGIDILEVRAKARRLKLEHGLDLIILDYLQLMQGLGRNENRTQEISGISRALKGLAKELDVPLVALSQLSRAPETRGDHRPQLSDLRESGSIEQDADVVAFIYRDEMYNPEGDTENLAELILAKQRNGPTGKVELVFMKKYTKFENYTHRADNPAEPEPF